MKVACVLGDDCPLIPVKFNKVTLFTIILYNEKIAFAISGHFVIHCFVTAVL